MGIYADRLKRMQKSMDEQMADYTPGGFSLLPEGEYSARVQATLDETKKEPKRLMVTWAFTVSEGNSEGRKVFDRTIIEDNQIGAQICRGRIEDLGYVWPEDITELEDLLETITANPPCVAIRVTHDNSKGKDGKDYTNARVRITDVLESTAPPAEETGEAEAEAPTEESDPNLVGLLALCGSYQLAYITDDMDIETIVQTLKDNGATFKQDDLQPEELAVLESVDESLIERPESEPVKPPARKLAPPSAKKLAVKAPVKSKGKR